MAMAVAQGGGGGGRAAGAASKRPMSEINVTPMVDVMLVLLIVFMVAAPLMTVGVPIDLPQTAGQGTQYRDQADHRVGDAGWRDLHRRPAVQLDGLVDAVNAQRQWAPRSASMCAATRPPITAR